MVEAKRQHEMGEQRPCDCGDCGLSSTYMGLRVSARGPKPSACSSAGPCEGEWAQPAGALALGGGLMNHGLTQWGRDEGRSSGPTSCLEVVMFEQVAQSCDQLSFDSVLSTSPGTISAPAS